VQQAEKQHKTTRGGQRRAEAEPKEKAGPYQGQPEQKKNVGDVYTSHKIAPSLKNWCAEDV